jgi:bifunctional non-homologous end joining protein LigD
MFPDSGITKGEAFEYYRQIATHLLPYLRDRPATLERVPEGIGANGPHFWQKHTPSYYPDWVPRIELPTEQGATVPYTLVNDERTLLYLVNQGTLTFHVWFSRVQNLDRPDFVLFDLDPGQATFADVINVARELHELLNGERIESYVKTTGKSGLHVLTPWKQAGGYDESRAWAQKIAARLAESMPQQATMDIRKAKRGSRVYIDTLQNARGHHAVPPYVIRAVPGAPVSTPLEWSELRAGLKPTEFTLRTIFARLKRQKSDPMAPLLRVQAKKSRRR